LEIDDIRNYPAVYETETFNIGKKKQLSKLVTTAMQQYFKWCCVDDCYMDIFYKTYLDETATGLENKAQTCEQTKPFKRRM
jgi:hypothetical protein